MTPVETLHSPAPARLAKCEIPSQLRPNSGVFLQQRKLVSDFVQRPGVRLDISDGPTVPNAPRCDVLSSDAGVRRIEGAGDSKTSIRRGGSSPPEIESLGMV